MGLFENVKIQIYLSFTGFRRVWLNYTLWETENIKKHLYKDVSTIIYDVVMLIDKAPL